MVRWWMGLPALALLVGLAAADLWKVWFGSVYGPRYHDVAYGIAAGPLLVAGTSAAVLVVGAFRRRRRGRWPLTVGLALVAVMLLVLGGGCAVLAFTAPDDPSQFGIDLGSTGGAAYSAAIAAVVVAGFLVAFPQGRRVAGVVALVSIAAGVGVAERTTDDLLAGADAPGRCGRTPGALTFPDDPGVGSRYAYATSRLQTVRPDGSDPVELSAPHPTIEVSWSREGRRAAYTRDGITVVDLDPSGRATHRSLGVEDAEHAAIDPAGDRIAYARDGRVRAGPVEGSPAEHVDLGPAGRTITWSFDGSRLLVGGADGTFVVDVATGERRLVPGVAGATVNHATWSPTADELAYQTRDQLVLASGDGAQRRLLLQSDETGFTPDLAWSPDGRLLSVVWTSVESLGFRSAICIVPLDGDQPQLLDTALDVTSSPPLWSPDGRFVLGTLDPITEGFGPATVAIDVRTGQVRRLPAAGGAWIAAPDDGEVCDVLATWVDGGPLYADDLAPFEATVASVLGRALRAGTPGEAAPLLDQIRPQLDALEEAGVTVTADSAASIEATVAVAVDECGLRIERSPTDVAPPDPDDDYVRWSLRYEIAIHDAIAPVARLVVPAVTGGNRLPPEGTGPDWAALRDGCAETDDLLVDLDELNADVPPEARHLQPRLDEFLDAYHDFVDTCLAAAAVEDAEQLRPLESVSTHLAELVTEVEAAVTGLRPTVPGFEGLGG